MAEAQASDFELLQLWVDGDRRAGDRLVKRHYLDITHFFANAVGDQERRELTQETFFQLCRAAPRFAARSSFRSFLFAIARNVLNGFLRDRYRQRGLIDEYDPTVHTIADSGQLTPSRLVSELVRRNVLIQCLRELPVESKELLELYYWHGLTAEQLGEIHEVPGGTIRTRIHTLCGKLRAAIAAREPSLGSLDVEVQLEVLRKLLGVGPTQMDR